MISGSALERVHACPSSEALPHAEEVNAWQERGNAVHEFLARVPEMGRDDALGLVPAEWREVCEAIDVDLFPAGASASFSAEVAIAYDMDRDTARVLGSGIDRQYDRHGLAPSEIPGSMDSVGVASDRVAISDYKSPWADLPPATRNRQMRFYALAAARAYDRSTAVVMVIRVREDGTPSIDKAVFDSMDLHEIAAEVREAVTRARAAVASPPESRPDLVVGSHCRWCPAARFCPAQAHQLVALADGSAEADIMAGITPELAALALERVTQAKRALERVEWTLRDYASRNPIPLPDGRVYGPRRVSTDVLDAERTARVLEKLDGYGPEAAQAAVESKVTKGSVIKIVDDHARDLGVTLKSERARVLDALRAGGAITTKKTTRVEAHKPKPDAVTAGA